MFFIENAEKRHEKRSEDSCSAGTSDVSQSNGRDLTYQIGPRGGGISIAVKPLIH